MDCKEGTRRMAGTITHLLDQIDAASYTKPLAIFNGSTLGQHIRHILDFYICLANGVDLGQIDYSTRERNPEIERDRKVAKTTFETIIDQICTCEEHNEIKVKADFSTDDTDSRPMVKSTIGRELMFAYDHAVHHLAIIKIGIRMAFPHLELEENLGIAPATVKYRAGGKAPDC